MNTASGKIVTRMPLLGPWSPGSSLATQVTSVSAATEAGRSCLEDDAASHDDAAHLGHVALCTGTYCAGVREVLENHFAGRATRCVRSIVA